MMGYIPKSAQKIKCVCFHEMIWLILKKMKMKNRSHRYDLGLDMNANMLSIESV